MNRNIDNCLNHCRQQAWIPNDFPNDSIEGKKNAVQQETSYSYQSYEAVKVEYVNLNSSSGQEASLDHFFNRLRDSLGKMIDFDSPKSSIPYQNDSSPESFAGGILRRIYAQFMSMEASFFGQSGKPIQPETASIEAAPSESNAVAITEIAPEAITEPEPVPPVAEEVTVSQPAPALEPENTSMEIVSQNDAETQVDPVAEAAQANAVNTIKNEFLGDIENGVESGYQGTVSDLTAANYPKKFMEIVDEANRLIKKGIQSLRHKEDNASPVKANRLFMKGFSESKDINLEILTRDGDLVTIDIGVEKASERIRYKYSDGDQIVRGKVKFDSLQQSLEFSVNGELDAEELEAISSLINDIASLADTFYKGDMGAALSQAAEIGFDSEELSGFTLDMSYQKTSYKALMKQKPNPAAVEGNMNGQSPFAEYIRKAIEDVKNISSHQALNLFENPQKVFSDIFKAITEQIEEATPAAEAPTTDFISGLTQELFS